MVKKWIRELLFYVDELFLNFLMTLKIILVH